MKMTNKEAMQKLFNILHDDRFSWTQESVDAFYVALEKLKNSTEELKNSNDLIERQAAIEWCLEGLNNMPSVQPERCEDCKNFSKTRLLIPQPEIVRCRDCKYWREHKYAKETKRYIPFCGFNAIYTKADDFCSKAERKDDV